MLSPFSEADSLQLTLVTDRAESCHYFLPGLRLPSQLHTVASFGRYQFILLGNT